MCTPVFIAILFTVTKIQKQSKCPLMGEWLKHIWYIYIICYGILFSLKKEGHLAICNNTDGPGRYYVK